MTIRKKLSNSKRKITIIMWSGFVASFGIFVAGIIMQDEYATGNPLARPLFIIAMIGYGLTFIYFMYHFYRGIPCPKCKTPWGYIVINRGVFSIFKKIKYCPFCGVDVDSELEKHQEK